MNNDENKKEGPFEVNFEDDGFLNPADLDALKPPAPYSNKKFEVHIDENDASGLDFDDQAPRYKGEIYFSNSRPLKPVPPAGSEKRAPGRKGPKKARKKRKIDSVVAVFCTVVFIFAAALSSLAISCVNDVLAIGRSEEKVKINIPNGADADKIIDVLSDEGLVKRKLFCKAYYKLFEYARNLGGPPNKKNEPPVFMSGLYIVQKNLGLEGYLNKFKRAPKVADVVTLVFPEGWTIYQAFKKIQEFGVCDANELLASLNAVDFDYDFIKEIPNDPERTFKLEGYFYPSTYEFFEKSDANNVIRKFLDASRNKWTDEYEKRRKELGFTRDEIITIASIIQREAADAEQMKLISSVIHNRLNHAVSWPMLDCNSTEKYITIFVAPHVAPDRARALSIYYDSYGREGLPPGPICNPGDDAIKAALYPASTDYYFFRHDKYGKIYMAKTQAEHDKNGNEVLRVNSR